MELQTYEAMVKLSLTEDERATASDLADALLKSVSALDAIGTEGVRPLVTVLDIQNVFREDIAVKRFSREELLSNAPEQYDGYFQVPKAIE